MVHVDFSQSAIPVSIQNSTMSSRTIYMNSNGVVNQTAGSVYQPYAGKSGGGANVWHGAGLLMSVPVVDDTPYRVKAVCGARNCSMHIFVGNAPAAPTGSDDLVTQVVSWPIIGEQEDIGSFDEVLLIKANDTLIGGPLAFGIGIAVGSGTMIAGYNISVQNLAKTAPQFAASMS